MLYFFDIDGCLVAPRFEDHGKMIIGFNTDKWKQYCLDHKNDGYDNCVLVKPVLDYAKKMKKEGNMIFIITGIGSEAEMEMKHEFFGNKGLIYGDDKVFYGINDPRVRKRGYYHANVASLFTADFYTEEDYQKIQIISHVAACARVPVSDCVLVDDTFDLLLRAKIHGIKAIHPSNIMTNSISE